MSSIDKSIQILNYLNNAKRSVRITELGSKLSLPKSTVHRFLKILLKYSIVDQEKDTKKYRVGLGVVKYSSSFFNTFDFRPIVRPVLEKICAKVKENASLMVWRNNKVICIDSFNPSLDLSISLSLAIGTERPFHCSAAGKILLAYKCPEDIEKIIYEKPLQRFTSITIIDPKKLSKNLKEIRENGFAICYGEFKEGVVAVAAPIKNINREVVASIVIAGIFPHISSDNAEMLVKVVTDSAQEISEKLGYKAEMI